MPVKNMKRRAPLSDAIIASVSRLVDDAQTERRDPSHADLKFLFDQVGLSDADLQVPAGKERRVRQVLSWAMEQHADQGSELVFRLIAAIKGSGGFRPESSNYVGKEAVENAREAFATECFELTDGGELHPVLLEGLDDPATPSVLRSYIHRASKGATDAALLVGTGKDLMEATAAYVILRRFGSYEENSNFPTLLGQAYAATGLATPNTPPTSGDSASRDMERALFDAACAVNRLRNREGTGHGRPFVPEVTADVAKAAIQITGVVAELLLNACD
jgi:Abortive infection C-terminus